MRRSALRSHRTSGSRRRGSSAGRSIPAAETRFPPARDRDRNSVQLAGEVCRRVVRRRRRRRGCRCSQPVRSGSCVWSTMRRWLSLPFRPASVSGPTGLSMIAKMRWYSWFLLTVASGSSDGPALPRGAVWRTSATGATSCCAHPMRVVPWASPVAPPLRAHRRRAAGNASGSPSPRIAIDLGSPWTDAREGQQWCRADSQSQPGLKFTVPSASAPMRPMRLRWRDFGKASAGGVDVGELVDRGKNMRQPAVGVVDRTCRRR